MNDRKRELINRKKELKRRRQEELALREIGKEDNMALFIVEEELLEVNAQLRALEPGRRVGAKRAGASKIGEERAAYRRWAEGSEEANEALALRRHIFEETFHEIAGNMTERQRQVMELWQKGKSGAEIGRMLGIERSTVSRILMRAKQKMREEAENRIKAADLEGINIDLANQDIARVILSFLTEKQAIYIYLYYGEWLSLRDIEALTGVDHAGVYNTICRGMGAITKRFECNNLVLENVDALSDFAYQCYLEYGISDIEEVEDTKESWGRRTLAKKRGEYYRNYNREKNIDGNIVLRRSDGREELWGASYHSGIHKAGKLLEEMLLHSRSAGDGKRKKLMSWLQQLFRNLTGR